MPQCSQCQYFLPRATRTQPDVCNALHTPGQGVASNCPDYLAKPVPSLWHRFVKEVALRPVEYLLIAGMLFLLIVMFVLELFSPEADFTP